MSKENNDFKVCKFDELNKDDTLLTIDNIEYIPLETTDSLLIGDIGNILYRNNCFYIFDDQTKTIFVFDKKGEFLFKINKYGNGPGEYVQPLDMDVDDNGNIYVSDNAKCNIIKYEPLSMDYKIFNIEMYFSHFCYLNDSLFALNDVYKDGKLYSKLTLYSVNDSNLKHLQFPTYENLRESVLMNAGAIYKSADKIYYYKRFTPIISVLNKNGELTPFMKIESNKYASEDLLRQLETEDMASYFHENKFIKNITDIYETNEFFICRLDIKPSFDYIVMSKKDGAISYVDLTRNKRFNGCCNIKGVAKNKFISIMTYDEILANNYNKIPELKDWNEDSNPVILLFTFKIKEE